MYSELCVQKLVEHRGKKITNEVMNKQLFKTHFVCCYLKMAITLERIRYTLERFEISVANEL